MSNHKKGQKTGKNKPRCQAIAESTGDPCSKSAAEGAKFCALHRGKKSAFPRIKKFAKWIATVVVPIVITWLFTKAIEPKEIVEIAIDKTVVLEDAVFFITPPKTNINVTVRNKEKGVQGMTVISRIPDDLTNCFSIPFGWIPAPIALFNDEKKPRLAEFHATWDVPSKPAAARDFGNFSMNCPEFDVFGMTFLVKTFKVMGEPVAVHFCRTNTPAPPLLGSAARAFLKRRFGSEYNRGDLCVSSPNSIPAIKGVQNYLVKNSSVKQATAAMGLPIVPGDEPTPELRVGPSLSDLKDDCILFFAGNNVCGITKPLVTQPLFCHMGTNLLQLEKNGKEALMSGEFRDSAGNLLLELRKNRIVSINQNLSLERGSNWFSLYDPDQKTQLISLRYLNPNALSFVGTFWIRAYYPIFVTPESIAQNKFKQSGDVVFDPKVFFWSGPLPPNF